MNLSRSILCAIALCAAAGTTTAQTTVSVSGRITATPCTISTSPVNMGKVPFNDIVNNGGISPQKYEKDVSIRFEGCRLSSLNSASLSFSGPMSNNRPFILALTGGTGAAEGFGIRLVTSDVVHAPTQRLVDFTASTQYPIDVTSNQATFAFRASYVVSGSPAAKPGVANATATVTVTYT
ncbi:fimbrial protein [Achromobacter spanius]|uniref:fimbrial protein n=1 Tax=Achromobacter spanius TaxID=217203 RepID=UPI00381BF98F